jgi:uncharacterized protein with PQ loop repeat
MTSAGLIGTLGVLLNQVFIWPQVRLAFTSVEGLSALTVLSGLLARTLWTAYGVVLADRALLVGNVTVATGFLLLVLLLLRASAERLLLVMGVMAVAAVVLVATLAGNAILGWTAVVTAAVVNLPQMVRALLDRRRLAGVSVATHLLIAAASACWLAYGVLVDELLISAPHVLLLPTALVTAWLAARPARH